MPKGRTDRQFRNMWKFQKREKGRFAGKTEEAKMMEDFLSGFVKYAEEHDPNWDKFVERVAEIDKKREENENP